jgi:hypothetical protein
MAVEQRRACGFRKVGGLYLCADGLGAPCCKMPILLHVCPTCHGGIKQSRGWTWIDPRPFLKNECTAQPAAPFAGILNSFAGAARCPLTDPNGMGERVGLLWIGEQFYKTPSAFQIEASQMGVSRRIAAIPQGFKLGEHWVWLAHPKVKENPPAEVGGDVTWTPGVFRIFKPTRIEKIITETMAADQEEMAKLEKRGITPVIVPSDDKDHVGTVYDDASDTSAQQELFDGNAAEEHDATGADHSHT